MKDALRDDRGIIATQRDAYARFVPQRMLELFDKSSVTSVMPRDCKALELTVMFSDIRSYTSISEGLSCAGVFDLLNSYFEMTNPIIGENGGIIDKYIGDTILSLFPDSPNGALRSAIAINRKLRDFNSGRGQSVAPDLLTGTGVHFGSVELGTVEDSTRLQATVIGDAVNLASRLESATKAFGVRRLMSEAARQRLKDPAEFNFRLIDTVRVKGKKEPIGLYEVFDLDEAGTMDKKLAMASILSEALRLYRDAEFSQGAERNALARVFGELIDYTVYHFQTEERLFTELSYPDATSHKKEHDELTAQALALQGQFEVGDLVISFELLDFLYDWLMNHTSDTDLKFKEFLGGIKKA